MGASRVTRVPVGQFLSGAGPQQKRKLMFFALALVCLALGSASTRGAQSSALARVPNTTLRMPENPPPISYTTSNAFPTLSFLRPVAIVTPPGEIDRLFVVEQYGRIAVITNLGSPTRTLFLDITDRVLYGSEEGLLALAFHPGYATNGYFYVWYTTSGTRYDRLSRFQVDPNNPARALPQTEQILINQRDQAENHNGGQLLFGPDGYLYLSLGDEGLSASIDNWQRVDRDFFAGIIRIDVDQRPESILPNPHPANTNNATGTFNYAIPPDNPFIGITNFIGRGPTAVDPAHVRTEFWAVGLRNPWRMSFDRTTGILYCADVGASDREEVDIIVKGGNYGWPYYEGSIPSGLGESPPSGFKWIEPIQDYTRGGGTNQGLCIIGGFVYRGTRYPDLYGAYIFGDYVSGNIWAMRYNVDEGQTNITPFSQIALKTEISAFGEDPSNGDVLLAGHYENQIRRLVRASASAPPIPPTLAETGAFSDLSNLTPHPGIVPYDINVPFWSDYARKTRWFSVPDTYLIMSFDSTGNWSFPNGTVWIKHFDLELTNGVASSARRLETRFIVRNLDGVYGVTYRWDSQTNATLVPDEGMDESFIISDGGIVREQIWHYPGRSECLQCHTRPGGLALGFNTAQLNRDFNYGSATENQLLALSRAGYLDTYIHDPRSFPALAHATNLSSSVGRRARSYLAANCSQCHQPEGTGQGLWDARFSTPLSQAGIINGALVDDGGNSSNRVIQPGSIENSAILTRLMAWGRPHMPPLATSEPNQEAIALLRFWITNELLNAPPVALPDTLYRYPLSGTTVRAANLLANDSDSENDELTVVSVSPSTSDGATVSLQGDWIQYNPPPGLTDEDVFTYQISDGHNEPVTGSVTIRVIWDSLPSPDLAITHSTGACHIRFDGVPGLSYRIEYTSSLNPPQWQNLGTATGNETGQFGFIDIPPARFTQRFYRAVYP
jgi:uncharacterized repeat protein (TIGR03806 family)